MGNNIRIGQIWNIPIRLNVSWFLIFGLVTWSLAVGYFPEEYPALSGNLHWILGGVTSILFFGSVLLHELGHAFVSLRYKIPVRSITLFLFGGVAQIESEPKTAVSEFWIAIAGPIVSFLLAGLFGALWMVDRSIEWLAAPSLWLARINLILALFNLIPGFPLDGGRVLRAAVWQFSGSFQKATRWAAASGQLVAFGFIAFGLYRIVTGSFFDGLWLIFIGWFLQNAAAASSAQVNLQESFADLTVADAMLTDWPQVSSRLPLNKLVEEKVMRGGPRYYFVERDGYGHDEGDKRPFGMLSLTDITRIGQANWSLSPAEKVMVPWEKLVIAAPEEPLLDALQRMDQFNVAQVPVVEKEQMIGVLPRDQVLHYVSLRSKLKI